ncbi:hypothetical protein EC991_001281 [Linnemannia zychae]|nr:hypothetical protein EC991_001281 [Linnemannia zychae]
MTVTLFEVKTEGCSPSDDPLKKHDHNTFPRRERTLSGNVDPKGAFRFTPRLNRRNANNIAKTLSFASLTSSTSSGSNGNCSSNNDSQSSSNISSNSNSNSNNITDISTMASSYSSAKLAPPVAGITVDALELGPDSQLWYTIQVQLCPMHIPGSDAPPVPRRSYSIYRRYEDIVDFAERLEQEFPWLKTYTDGSQDSTLSFFRKNGPAWSLDWSHVGNTQSDTSFAAECAQRKHDLGLYFKQLFTLGSILSRCRLVSEFFGIWKTDLNFHLSQADQDPLALHSVAHHRASPVASGLTKNAEPNDDSSASVQTGEKRNSSASTAIWSPSVSSPSSVSSSPVSTPPPPPSPRNKRVACLWDARPSMLDACQHISASPNGSSYHGSDHEDSDGCSDCTETSAESDNFILEKFPPPPPFIIKKATSLQNLRQAWSQRVRSSSSSSPLSKASPQALSVVTFLPSQQHTFSRSFGEGTLPSELAPLGIFSPRPTSLPNSQNRRTSLQHPGIHPRRCGNDHANCHNCSSDVLASTAPKQASRLYTKQPAYVSTSLLSTGRPLTPSAQSLTKSMQEIALFLNVSPNGLLEEPQQKEHHDQETNPISPLFGKAPMTSTAPLSPRIRAYRKEHTTNEPKSLPHAASQESDASYGPSSSSLSSEVQGPAWPTEAWSRKHRVLHTAVSTTNQKRPASILNSGHSSLSTIKGNSTTSNAFAHHQQQQARQATSPPPGASFLAQHPQGFAATIKIVVSADVIIALQILEEEPGFQLSVPDLRLRVLNKFRRMNMGVPADFELMWTGWDGTRVLLKNDEELQRALKYSTNNKLISLMVFAAGIRELVGGPTWFFLHSDAISWGLVILSVIVFLASVLGGVCALSQSKRIAATYRATLSILVLLQLIFLIYAMARHDHVDKILGNAWQKAYDTNERGLQDLETRLHCCGYESVTDRAVPKYRKDACITSPSFGYKVSCKHQLQEAYEDHERLAVASITGIEVLQLLALLATIALLKFSSDDTIEERFSTEHSRRLLRGLRSEDEGRAGYDNQSGSTDTRGGYGSTRD